MIPDGTCNSPKAWACWLEQNDLGFGKRSWRYSMLVNDGVVEKMFIRPGKKGDPFEGSDANTMLKYVCLRIEIARSIAIFTKPGCQFCAKAKKNVWMKKAWLTKRWSWVEDCQRGICARHHRQS